MGVKKLNNFQKFLILCLAVFVLFELFLGFRDTAGALKNVSHASFILSSEDSNLIAPPYKREMKVVAVYRNNKRGDLLVLAIGEQYIATVEKLPMQQGVPLTEAIHVSEELTDRTNATVYIVWPFNNYTYQQNAACLQDASEIHLAFSGDAMRRQTFTDSLVSFSLETKTISLKYAYDGPTDIFIAAKQPFFRWKRVPMNFAFLKKNGAIYFIVLTSSSGEALAKTCVIDTVFN